MNNQHLMYPEYRKLHFFISPGRNKRFSPGYAVNRFKNLVKNFTSPFNKFFNYGQAEKAKMNYNEVLSSFKDFTMSALSRYEYDFELMKDQFSADLLDQFQKPFYNELIDEGRRVYELYEELVPRRDKFRKEIEQIAENGLADFKKLTAGMQKI